MTVERPSGLPEALWQQVLHWRESADAELAVAVAEAKLAELGRDDVRVVVALQDEVTEALEV